MTPEDLKAWRAQMGLNQRDAAAASEDLSEDDDGGYERAAA